MFSAVKEVISSAADGALHLMGLDKENVDPNVEPDLAALEPEAKVVTSEKAEPPPSPPTEVVGEGIGMALDSEAKKEEAAAERIEKLLNEKAAEPKPLAPEPPAEDEFSLSKWTTKQTRV